MLYNKIRKTYICDKFVIWVAFGIFSEINHTTNGNICGEKITNHFDIILWHWKAGVGKRADMF